MATAPPPAGPPPDPATLAFTDAAVREYLLYRGFARAAAALAADARADPGLGLQADALTARVFRVLIPEGDARELLDTLAFLSHHVFGRCDPAHAAAGCAAEAAALRAFLVAAAAAGRPERVRLLLAQVGDDLAARPDADDWAPWFALAFVSDPRALPQYKPFFSPDWADAAACTFRNAVAAAVASLPPPALLSLDAARAARDELKARVAALEGQLSAATAALAAATAVEEDQAEEGDGDDGGAWRPGGGGSGDGGSAPRGTSPPPDPPPPPAPAAAPVWRWSTAGR